MASLDDLVTVGNSFNKNLSQLIVALQDFQTVYQAIIDVPHGGTGRTSLTANNVLLGNGTSPINFVAPGTSGNVLTSNGTTWNSTALPVIPANVSSIDFGTTGLTPSTATTGAVTVAGTLNIENGGTEKTSFTAYGVVCGGTGTQTALQSVSPGTSGQILTSAGASALPSFQDLNNLTAGTAKTFTSSTSSYDFPTFPSWVKKVTLIYDGIIITGTLWARLITTGGTVLDTGYVSALTTQTTGSVNVASTTTGFYVGQSGTYNGAVSIYNITGTVWVCSGTTINGTPTSVIYAGNKDAGTTINSIRLIPTAGNITGGTVNIFYE